MPDDTDAPSSQQEDAVLLDATAEPAGENGIKSDPDKAAVNINIDDIFGSDDEEELLNSSAAQMPGADDGNNDAASSPPNMPISSNGFQSSDYSDPDVMLAYYSRLFPFRPFFLWLNHSMKPSNAFGHREFAFTLSNDAYLRYQSYPTAELLRKDVLRLNPSRFEIGPVYSTNPRDRKQLRAASKFRPISKELVFDIDMTDYDEIRTCCSGAAICTKCWSWMTMAVKVVDVALREDFGFRHILWVYSGRRGIHAWISDRRARDMDDSRRKAIAGYMNLIKGGDQSGKKVNVRRPLHPHLVRSLKMLEEHFARDVLEGQDPWREEERAERLLLPLLPDQELARALKNRWASSPGRSSAAKWADIDKVAASGSAGTKLNTRALLEAKQDIVLEYTYPRLDAAVSLHLNHLLKSPFVVHPKTGRVCVPVDPAAIVDFDPETVPKVTEVLSEIDAWVADEDESMGGTDERNGGGDADRKPIQDYEKTRLKPYIELFKRHAAAIVRDERGIKSEPEDDGVGGGGGGDPMEF